MISTDPDMISHTVVSHAVISHAVLLPAICLSDGILRA